MQKNKVNDLKTFFFFSLLLITFNSKICFVSGYWSDEDENCMPLHGIDQINAIYLADLNLNLDGVDDEDDWGKTTEYTIPIAAKADDPTVNFFKSYVKLKILYDDSNIYLMVRWNDSSITPYQDGISICWNINTTNYSVSMFTELGGMQTYYKNQTVDNWGWKYTDYRENKTSFKLNHGDGCFGVESWIDEGENEQDISAGFIYGDWIDGTNHYQVEFNRSLITGDEKDVQFDKNGDYLLSFIILNDVGSVDHGTSWTWKVIFDHLEEEPIIDGYNVLLFLTFTLLSIGSYLLFSKSKRKYIS
ncbi:MAG: hypothetical protein GY870_19585 [archaeon]|nr:hypothetical protein [archaeon]